MAEDFAGFNTEVQDKLTKLGNDIDGEIKRIAGLLNDARSWWDWVPLVGDDLSRAITKWNDEILPQMGQKMGEVWDGVGKVVSEMAGNPIQLKELSHKYADCKAKLEYQAPSIESEIQQLGKFWSGHAYDAYAEAAGEQVQAMTDIASAMENASDMTNLAAQKILQLWVDLNNEIVNAGVAIIKILADATSIEGILSFEIPVIIGAIGDLLDFVQKVAKVLEDYMIGVGFPDQLEWRQMNNGQSGLPGNKWPVIHPDQIDDLSDPGDWQPQG